MVLFHHWFGYNVIGYNVVGGHRLYSFWLILKTADLPAPELVSLSTTAFFDSWARARNGEPRPRGLVKSWPAFADTGSNGYTSFEESGDAPDGS